MNYLEDFKISHHSFVRNQKMGNLINTEVLISLNLKIYEYWPIF